MKLKEFLNNGKYSKIIEKLFFLHQQNHILTNDIEAYESQCNVLRKKLEENKKQIDLILNEVNLEE